MADRRLQVFHAVAKHLSFTKAAEALFMTQPAVTFQIRQLEEQFNTRLFDRAHGRIALTPAGQVAPEGQGVAIAFRSDPDPPASGDNAYDVTVTQPDGSPVTDATVMVVFSMPAMPAMNMPGMRSEASLAHEGSGRYRGTGQLEMGGTWNVLVTVSRGTEEIGRKNLSVIAK